MFWVWNNTHKKWEEATPNEEEEIIDIPDDVAGTVDMWLTEVEEEQNEFDGRGI